MRRFAQMVWLTAVLVPSTAPSEQVLPPASFLHHAVQGALEQKRNSNRADTRRDWSETGITFPCAAAIAKAKAAGKALPQLIVNSELHDSAYCNFRMNLLVKQQTDARMPVCLAVEHFAVDTEGALAKGLENPEAKLLSSLIFAFEDLTRRGVAKESGQTLPDAFGGLVFLMEGMSTPLLKATWRAQEKALRAEFPKAHQAIDLLRKAQESANWTKQEATTWKTAFLAQYPSALPMVRKLIGVLAQDIETRSKGGRLAGETTPKQLSLEVAMALEDIENEARSPGSLRSMLTKKERFKYLNIGWRDRHMARNLAKLYCDNLESPTPLAQVHAIVGALHIEGMLSLLLEDSVKTGIAMTHVDGKLLNDAWTKIVGEPTAAGTYLDQPLKSENIDGKPFILSQQMGSARIVVVLKRLEPLDGSSLSTPGTLMHFGPDGSLQKMLGLDPAKPVPATDKMQLATKLLNEYTASMRKK